MILLAIMLQYHMLGHTRVSSPPLFSSECRERNWEQGYNTIAYRINFAVLHRVFGKYHKDLKVENVRAAISCKKTIAYRPRLVYKEVIYANNVLS